MKSEGATALPSEVTNLLGKSPYEYFQAGMEMVNQGNKRNASEKKGSNPAPNPTPMSNGLDF